ncbi:MAG: C39 family peptidase [Candidatus Helarchaeota archaeon]|nr:C39 family peptidase [Candidatus Helarchaeota archaeon]
MKKFILFSIIVLFLGCAGSPPVKNPQTTKSNPPQQCLIENVPLYVQLPGECGSTSLRMVLNFYGKNLSQEEVDRARRGKLLSISDMESYVRMQGFEVYSFYDHKKEEMKFLLAQGYPLIVFGVKPSNWPWGGGQRFVGEGHFVVVLGYDDLKKIFIIHDPGSGVRMEVRYDIFKEFHDSSSYEPFYVLCIYPKGK